MEHLFKYNNDKLPQYLTISIIDGYPLLMDASIRTIILQEIKQLYLSQVNIFAFVIMPNHLHIVAQHAELEPIIHSFQQKVSAQIISYLIQSQKTRIVLHLEELSEGSVSLEPTLIWDSPFGSTPIHNQNQLEKYIWLTHHNPVKSGIVCRPDKWRWSSCLLLSEFPEPLDLNGLSIPV